MNVEQKNSGHSTVRTATALNVRISPFINQQCPPWDELLSAHDVARLTRRPRLLVPVLAFCRVLPRKRRYQGRVSGWLRSEILETLTAGMEITLPAVRQCAKRSPRQTCLPLECRAPCEAVRKASGKRTATAQSVGENR